MVRLVIALVLAHGLGACSGEVAGGEVDGTAVFATVCATCHGPIGQPNQVMRTRLGVRDLTAPEFRARVTPELVEAQVHNGSKNKLMPAFDGVLSDAQITAVASYVASPRFVAPR